MPGFVKVFISKRNIQDYKDIRVKRTIVIVIECMSGDNRYSNLMII